MAILGYLYVKFRGPRSPTTLHGYECMLQADPIPPAKRCRVEVQNGHGKYKPGPIISGQIIIATSHDLTPNGGLVREIPLFREI